MGFFAGTAAGTPAVNGQSSGGNATPRQIGKQSVPKRLERCAVPVEPRDGDPAARIEPIPLVHVGLKERAVLRNSCKTELLHTSSNALAHLSANLSKTRPPVTQSRKAPLEKGNAIGVFHWAIGDRIDSGGLQVKTSSAPRVHAPIERLGLFRAQLIGDLPGLIVERLSSIPGTSTELMKANI